MEGQYGQNNIEIIEQNLDTVQLTNSDQESPPEPKASAPKAQKVPVKRYEVTKCNPEMTAITYNTNIDNEFISSLFDRSSYLLQTARP